MTLHRLALLFLALAAISLASACILSGLPLALGMSLSLWEAGTAAGGTPASAELAGRVAGGGVGRALAGLCLSPLLWVGGLFAIGSLIVRGQARKHP